MSRSWEFRFFIELEIDRFQLITLTAVFHQLITFILIESFLKPRRRTLSDGLTIEAPNLLYISIRIN
jgi:hypothetical protein